MSQTETIMLIALGFVAALLVSLLVIRGVWRYGLSLGKRRIERRAPSAIAELKADRDRLKAEFAMQGRRLQLRLDDLKTRMAEQMAEASRNRNRLEQLASEIGNRDKQLSQRDAEIANLKSQLESLERELADRTGITQQARDDLRRREEEIAALRERLAVADARLAEQTYMLESMQSPAASIASASGASSRSATSRSLSGVSADTVEDRLRQKIAELNELTRQIDEQRRDLTFQHSELTTLREQLDRSREIDDGTSRAFGGKPDRIETGSPKISLIDIESAGQKLEQQILDAERETESLTAELARLDELWNGTLQEMGKAPNSEGAEAGSSGSTDAGNKPSGKSGARAAGGKTGQKKADTAKTAARTARSPGPKKPSKGKKPGTSATAKSAGSRRTRSKPAKPSEAPETGETKRTPEDNVISLAQRIRALQNDLGGKKP
jgi:predicted nuclease with TOPRIM domain